MRCPTCGTETHEGQRFCMDCGAPLDATAAPTRQLPNVTGSPTAAPTAVMPAVGLPSAAARSGQSPPATAVGAQHDAQRPESRPPAPGAPPDAEQTGARPAAPSGIEPIPIRIVEQTSSLSMTGVAASLAATGTAATPHEVVGMVWHPIAVDPWPTPRSSPTVVAAPLHPLPLIVAGLTAALLGTVGSIVAVGSYRFADGTSGRFALNDLRSNSLGVMLAAVAVLLVGLGLAVGHQRMGAGLAGGAATALCGLAMMDVALIVAQLQEARRIGLATGVVTITWEPGFYVVVGAGVLGIVAAAVALGAWREVGQPVPAVIALLGSLAVAVMITGALVPVEGRDWSDNLDVPGFGAVPSWLRLGALALVGAAGLVGFGSRRRWATGLAVGATAALAAQWIGAWNPPVPNHRGGPGVAITPLDGAAQAIHAGGLLAVVVLGLGGWILAERRG